MSNNIKEYIQEIQNEPMTKITIICKDRDANLQRLIEYIGANGNTGHSFDIIVDPDGDIDQKKTFGWDGDGMDYIKDVKVEEL